MKIEKKMIICESCGAEYDVALVRCPYCGGGYAPAEEDEYMGGLEDIRKDLESHTEAAENNLKKSVGKLVLIVVVIIAVIIILLFGILGLTASHEKRKGSKNKEEFLINQGIEIDQEDQDK